VFQIFHVDTELEFLVAEAVGVSDVTFVKCVIHKMMSLSVFQINGVH